MPRSPTYILLAFLASVLLPPSSLEGQHPSWHNFTINEGLPSNEIYYMIQDSRHFLWFATNLGVCRFNGYEFTRPVDTSAAASSSSFQIVEDAQGRIWFNRLDGTLWVVERDTVRPWPHNHLAKSFLKKYRPTLRFAVGNDGTVWIPSWGGGFLVVQPDGAQQIVPTLNLDVTLFAEIDGQIICAEQVNQNDPADRIIRQRRGQTSDVMHLNAGEAVSLGRFPLDYSRHIFGALLGVWRLKNGDFAGNIFQDFYLIRDNKLVWNGKKDAAAKCILEDVDGSILMTVHSDKNRGLLRFSSLEHFQRNEFDNLLPGHAATIVLRGHEGGLWVSTTDAGVFYCKNSEPVIFDAAAGLPTDAVLTLTSDGRERVFAGLSSLDVAVFTRGASRPALLPSPPIYEWQILRFDTLSGRLWAGNDFCYFEKNRWRLKPWIISGIPPIPKTSFKKITPDPAGTRLWASAFAGFYSLDQWKGTAVRIPRDSSSRLRTFTVTPDREGNLWVTTSEGLRLWRDGRYEMPPFTHPALRFQARNVEWLPPEAGGGIVIALLGGGLLLRDENGNFTHLTTRDGLTADWISELEIGPDGVIYGCSAAGLNILTPPRVPGDHWHIETFTVKHGLPSNLVNDVALLDDEIWVATDKGIARFREKPTTAPMPVPMLEKFAVNNRALAYSQNLQLEHNRNNIALRFFALHFRSGGDIPYRYRLLGADTAFTYTRTREVNFANLSPGRYTFEVQAQNEDGQWSEPSRWPFEIRPPWWATWWFRTLVAAILAAASIIFYQNRLQLIRRETAEREKVRELEAAALRAQMNPHFIFNCLQAIQSFIAQNDRNAAAGYLARFAKLVRLALHSSVDGRHTLTEEMAMLENYLHLEQLRFRGKFEFSIRAAAGLDPEEITLPPLLVQPFVENALIHGLRGRENSGFVEVFFAKKGNALEVSVTDNGQGFSEKEAAAAEKHQHKSVGMMLTQKRLDLLAGASESDESRFTRETVFDENGAVAGTRVQLVVPVFEAP